MAEAYRVLAARHQRAVDRRYALQPWQPDEYEAHKQADRLAAASEALHGVGATREAIRDDPEIGLTPLEQDPLPPVFGGRAWEPWPATEAAERFLRILKFLLSRNPRDSFINIHESALT